MKKLFAIESSLLGDGKLSFAWHPKGLYLAAAGSKRKACVFDKAGKLVKEIFIDADKPAKDSKELPLLQWDPSGDYLAVVPPGTTHFYVWEKASGEPVRVDTEFKTQDLTAAAWSRGGMGVDAGGGGAAAAATLALGTSKGNLLLYNAAERRKTPYLGKHTKRITSAMWVGGDVLVMCGLDRIVTVTDAETGDTIKAFSVKGDPAELLTPVQKPGVGSGGGSSHLPTTCIVNAKSLVLGNVGEEKPKPSELNFLDVYGDLGRHVWIDDSHVALGFNGGQLVIVSAAGASSSSSQGAAATAAAASEEVHSSRLLDLMSDMAFSGAAGKIAVGGGSSVKLVDTGSNFKELRSEQVELDGGEYVHRLGWTPDGSMLTVSTTSGALVTYLTSLPVLGEANGSRMVVLSSLNELSVINVVSRSPVARVQVDLEPAVVGLGPSHVAAGMNNTVYYYRYGPDRPAGAAAVNKRSYLGSVKQVQLNGRHAAILSEGRVLVHPIEGPAPGSPASDEFDLCLPAPSEPGNLACASLTEHFLITGSSAGSLGYYLVAPEGLTVVNETKHAGGGIRRLFPQPGGHRLVCEDDARCAFMYSPVNDLLLPLPQFDGLLESVAWDATDPHTFVAADSAGTAYVYVYVPTSLKGSQLVLVSRQALGPGYVPVSLSNGLLGCRLKTSGSLDHVVLDSHRSLQSADKAFGASKRFAQCLQLHRLKDAWDAAVAMRSGEAWAQLADAALGDLDLDLAVACYRQLGDASMVLSLEALKPVEDKALLAAHVLVLARRDYDGAQELFLRSAQPKAALQMRKDLKHWGEALRLAEQLDPGSVGVISKENAQMLELTGEHQAARAHYQKALDLLSTSPPPADTLAAGGRGGGGRDQQQDVVSACKAGIARTTLLCGDVRQGRQLALQLRSQPLFRECGGILEGLGQLSEAAEMYERGGLLERAAGLYIQTKNWTAAAPLMQRISSSKLQLQFAKAKEGEGRYAEAEAAYELAGDVEAVIRLNLEQLGNAGKAFALVRKSRLKESGLLVAKYALQRSDYKNAVEFLVMSGQVDQAFDIAQSSGHMKTYADALVAAGSSGPREFERIATYFESRGEAERAGDMWVENGQPAKAVRAYLRAGSNEAVHKAVGVVEKTRSKELADAVMDYVSTNVRDGGLKDEFRFKLNIAMGQLGDAARDALEMARFEQEEGNYRVAHDKLLATHRQLRSLGMEPPQELVRCLMLLHSYTLVKSLIVIDDHVNAAEMLVRVARNISKFPKHVVPILTSTVIECHRAGMRKTAFEYASMLMRPEYRSSVAEKYKKKIELMVRKPDGKLEDPEQAASPCCFCGFQGETTELQCLGCQEILPFDIATGRRMTTSDWCECPACNFPCSGDQMSRVLAAERRCPMCNAEVDIASVRPVRDPVARLKAK